MQTELAADGRTTALLAVNEAGHESGLATMASKGPLPILQDTTAAKVWSTLGVTYRDVVILDAEGRWVDVYNLTANDLAKPENYAALKQKLLDAAK